MDQSENDSLLAAAVGGDSTKLGLLLESYRGYLRVLAEIEIGRRLQGKVGASDIVQETFLAAHRQFPKFEGRAEAQFAEWLRTILAGTLANTIRRYFGTQARDIRLERDLANDLNQSSYALSAWLVDPGSSPSQRAARGEQTLAVANALARLPANYALVLTLRHLEGLSFPEIAARMERSLDSVEKLWVRGLAKLKRECAEVSHDA